MKKELGFTTIEILTTLMIVGFIAIFIASFLMTGIQGFTMAKDAAETVGDVKPGMMAASTFMSDITGISCFETDTEMTFYNTDSEAVSVVVDAAGNSLSIGGSKVPNVTNATLSKTTVDVDGTTYVNTITMSFISSIQGVDKSFSYEFSPRTLVPNSAIAATCP